MAGALNYCRKSAIQNGYYYYYYYIIDIITSFLKCINAKKNLISSKIFRTLFARASFLFMYTFAFLRGVNIEY